MLYNYKDLVKRDVKQKEIKNKYQIQPIDKTNIAKLACVDKNMTDKCIHEEILANHICSLIIYTLTDDDLHKKSYNLIGFLVKNTNNNIICVLNVIFIPDNELEIGKQITGKYDIVITNSKGEKLICDSFSIFENQDVIIEKLIINLGEILTEL